MVRVMLKKIAHCHLILVQLQPLPLQCSDKQEYKNCNRFFGLPEGNNGKVFLRGSNEDGSSDNCPSGPDQEENNGCMGRSGGDDDEWYRISPKGKEEDNFQRVPRPACKRRQQYGYPEAWREGNDGKVFPGHPEGESNNGHQTC